MIEIAVLGASGVVGQKALALLGRDKRCRVVEVAASSEKRGVCFGEAVTWREEIEKPLFLDSMRFVDVAEITAPYVISALPSDIANGWEVRLAKRGHHVFSNAAAHRMDHNVPLLVPEVNLDHLELIDRQKTEGKIVTNPNCVAIFVALALAPLQELGPITHVSVVTLQATSGAGYPGVASLELLGNILPNIPGEADKIAQETRKILGTVDTPAPFSMTVHTHRVPVLHGHLATLHVHFADPISQKAASGILTSKGFPYRPSNLQPRTLKPDDHQVHFGRVTEGDRPNILGIQIMGHNLVRGAAGATLHNLHTFVEAGCVAVL